MQWPHATILFLPTGRSDYPNQINNVLGFPYIFRGALDTHAKAINEEMKLAAVYAIAGLAKEPVPDVVNAAYKLKRTTFGRDYILPKALDPRLVDSCLRCRCQRQPSTRAYPPDDHRLGRICQPLCVK